LSSSNRPEWSQRPVTQRQLRYLKDTETVPNCPTCGSQANSADGTFGIRHDCCGLSSWNYKPLQTQATLDARKAAHAAFDPLWQTGAFATRNKAYDWLSEQIGIPRKQCHMALMTEDQARLVAEACENIKENSNAP